MVALAARYGAGPVSLAEIAAQEGISLSYLEQLVGPLRQAGLLESVRGAAGGYRLSREPAAITVGEVVRPLEEIALVECVDAPDKEVCCERRDTCTTRLVWERLRDSIATALDSLTLADLCPRAA
jgi:Rrf2 family protein